MNNHIIIQDCHVGRASTLTATFLTKHQTPAVGLYEEEPVVSFPLASTWLHSTLFQLFSITTERNLNVGEAVTARQPEAPQALCTRHKHNNGGHRGAGIPAARPMWRLAGIIRYLLSQGFTPKM